MRSVLGQAGAPHQHEAARDGGRPAARGGLTPVGGRGHSGDLGEAGAERANAGEADQVADLCHGQVGRTQQLAGALHPPPGPVAARGLAVGGAERPDEVLTRVARSGGKRRYVDPAGVVAVDAVPGAAEHPQRRDVGCLAHRLRSLPGAGGAYSILVATGVPGSTVRLTVHSRSCDRRTAPGSSARAASPCSPSGNLTWKVTTIPARWLPASSRTFSAPTRTSNAPGSARREVRMSTSGAVQPPIPASSRSTGVKSVPMPIVPPRPLLAAYLLFPIRSSLAARRAAVSLMLATLP